jgi:hypothetical protein
MKLFARYFADARGEADSKALLSLPAAALLVYALSWVTPITPLLAFVVWIVSFVLIGMFGPPAVSWLKALVRQLKMGRSLVRPPKRTEFPPFMSCGKCGAKFRSYDGVTFSQMRAYCAKCRVLLCDESVFRESYEGHLKAHRDVRRRDLSSYRTYEPLSWLVFRFLPRIVFVLLIAGVMAIAVVVLVG